MDSLEEATILTTGRRGSGASTRWTHGRRPQGRGCARAWAAGFTLLELVLVLVIAGIVLGVSSPSLRRFLWSRRAGDAAREMVALAEYARSQAVVEGRAYRLNLDPEEGCFWLTAETAGEFVEPPTEFGRLFLLPQGTAARWKWPHEGVGWGWIGLYPDGRSDPVSILITDAWGEAVRVFSLSPAEPLQVVAAAEGEVL